MQNLDGLFEVEMSDGQSWAAEMVDSSGDDRRELRVVTLPESEAAGEEFLIAAPRRKSTAQIRSSRVAGGLRDY